jgi:hypothetical protein
MSFSNKRTHTNAAKEHIIILDSETHPNVTEPISAGRTGFPDIQLVCTSATPGQDYKKRLRLIYLFSALRIPWNMDTKVR